MLPFTSISDLNNEKNDKIVGESAQSSWRDVSLGRHKNVIE